MIKFVKFQYLSIFLFITSTYSFSSDYQWLITQWRLKSVEVIPKEGRTRSFNGGFECTIAPLEAANPPSFNLIQRTMLCKNQDSAFKVSIQCGDSKPKDSYELEFIGKGKEGDDLIIFSCSYCKKKCSENIDLPQPKAKF